MHTQIWVHEQKICKKKDSTNHSPPTYLEEELKLFLSASDLILYTENPKKFKHNKTERTSLKGCKTQDQYIKINCISIN